MTEQAIKEKIVQIAEETIGVSLQGIEGLKECGVDSLSLVTLIVSIEEAFNISFADDDLNPDTLRTVSSLVGLTEKYI